MLTNARESVLESVHIHLSEISSLAVQHAGKYFVKKNQVLFHLFSLGEIRQLAKVIPTEMKNNFRQEIVGQTNTIIPLSTIQSQTNKTDHKST
jgi:hypothetical protein